MTTKNNLALKRHKRFVGVVTSDKNAKTITVEVQTAKTNPIYHKRYKSTKKYHAHDEKNVANIGDIVEIIESRPRSALKRFDLVKIVSKAETSVNDVQLKEAK